MAPVPGETKVWQYITLMKRIFLIDCPGVVYNGMPFEAFFLAVMLLATSRSCLFGAVGPFSTLFQPTVPIGRACSNVDPLVFMQMRCHPYGPIWTPSPT